jgi:hypothetical protein
MRAAVVALGLVSAGHVFAPPTAGQERPPDPEVVPVRYGQPYRPKAYPQGSPREALVSVLAAADAGEYAYLTAHLLDPAFVDARLDAMTGGPNNPYRKAAEAELARLAAIQKRDPTALPEARRVPPDGKAFSDRLILDTKTLAFGQLARQVWEKFADDPEALKDLRKFARGGAFPDDKAGGDAAKVELPDVKDRAVFLKRVTGRWYVENRMADEKAPAADPKAEPDPKKEPEPKKDKD